ncbi:PilW family protein [Shewanella maritima]|uniref:PilW family protein n=1 Tax=Shewanella maritima TaxID=2520507 RepID=UPI003735FDCC
MIKKLKTLQSGMSLVELMVALVIGLFLTAGVFSMFSMSSSNVTTTSQFNQLQENGRIALAILDRDISQVGFFGDMTGTDLSGATIDNVVPAANDCIGSGLNNASLPNNQPANFRFLWGYENTVSANVLGCLASSNVKPSTDVLQLKRLIGPSTTPNGSNFFVSASNSKAVFFSGLLPSESEPSARTWEYQHHVYFIDDEDDVPVLSRKNLTKNGMNNDEQLVQGIENIRYLYGVDSTGDSTPEQYLAASNITSNIWDNSGLRRIVAVKIFLLVRSIQPDWSYTNKTSYSLGDKDVAPPDDNFRRKIMSSTVYLENPVLIQGL